MWWETKVEIGFVFLPNSLTIEFWDKLAKHTYCTLHSHLLYFWQNVLRRKNVFLSSTDLTWLRQTHTLRTRSSKNTSLLHTTPHHTTPHYTPHGPKASGLWHCCWNADAGLKTDSPNEERMETKTFISLWGIMSTEISQGLSPLLHTLSLPTFLLLFSCNNTILFLHFNMYVNPLT